MSNIRALTKREIEVMLLQIKEKDKIAIFNARKACYIYIDNSILGKILLKVIGFWLKYQLRRLDD